MFMGVWVCVYIDTCICMLIQYILSSINCVCCGILDVSSGW